MLILTLMEIITASILIAVGRFVPQQSRLSSVGEVMLKKYLLTMVLFSLYNVTFSTGITFRYGSASTDDILVMIITLLILVSVLYVMIKLDR